MKVELINHTQNARELLIFSKKTRITMSGRAFEDVLAMPEEQKEKELAYVFGTIGSSWEFVGYTFMITGVTRAFCLEKGTKIVTKKWKNNRGKIVECRGAKPIEEMQIGDEVLSYDTKTGKKEWDKVIFTSKHMANDWHHIEFDNGNGLSMTGEHPVYVVGRKEEPGFKPTWVQAKDMKIGDEAIQTYYLGLHSRTDLRGKTLEQSFGKQGALNISRKFICDSHKSFKERYGEDAAKEAEKRTKHMKDKTYEEILGKEKAATTKKMRKEQGKLQSNLPEESLFKLKNMWRDEREKMMAIARTGGIKSACSYFGKKSKSEERLEKIIDSICPNEFKYNGTGDLGPIGYRLPDFVNINGKKKVIELFGCYWHGCDACGYSGMKKKNDSKVYQDYQRLGYDCLIIWEHELANIKEISNRIKTFVYNPNAEIIKVKSIRKSDISRYSYNIETEKNHNFFAYGILTHNTHQLVRHRVGVSFAQQAQRVVDMSEFECLATGGCKNSMAYHYAVEEIKTAYGKLIKEGINPQDARGILPTNILTNILMKINLRSLSGLLNVRLCFKAQGEFQEVARKMREVVIKTHSWAEPVLQAHCVQHGNCLFPNFKECPIRPYIPKHDAGLVKSVWEKTSFELQSKEEK